VIRNQMLETRTALTEKLEALETTVVSAVQGTTESVAETVQNVKEAVQDTVSNVTESVQETVDTVKSTFDISKHVESYPWAMFGGAMLLGYLGGRLFPSLDTMSRTASSAASTMAGAASSLASSVTPGTGHNGHQTQSSSQDQGWLGGLTESFAPVLSKLEGLAVGTLAGVVGEMAMKAAPEEYKPHVQELLDQVTTALGGTPMHPSDSSQPGETPSQQPGPRQYQNV